MTTIDNIGTYADKLVRCPHCHSYLGAGDGHLEPGARTPRLAVGQSVVAREATAVCRVGEIGRVTEVHTMISGRPDWMIRFAEGGVDGWNPCEVGRWLEPQ